MRVRTTAGATAVVALALAGGGAMLFALLQNSLAGNIRTAADLRAQDVVTLLEAGTTPSDLAVEDEDQSFVQVLDSSSRVVAANRSAAGRPPLAAVSPGRSRDVRIDADGEVSTYVVVARATADRALVVLVARSLEPVSEGTAVVRAGLLVGVPLLVVLVGVTTWVVTGRALRPVEEIRTQVSAISATELDRRVPEPAGDDEIARLARTMNAMLARLQGSRDRQRRFISDASHELRSPLATIRHSLEVARARSGQAGDDGLLEDLLAESARMEDLVAGLLLLARADEVVPSAQLLPVDLDDLLLQEADRLRRRGVVRVDIAGVSAAQILGHQSSLQRLVRNLVDNAERHAGGVVRLGLRVDGSTVEVTVADDGPGVPAADRERIFERFTRVDEARAREGGGAGLGLAIVAEVARAHGGMAGVDDAAGGGARFFVTLPLAVSA